jgi:hypothetical protein
MAALFVLAYVLILAFRDMGFSSGLTSSPLQAFSSGLRLMFSQPTAIAVILLSRSSVRHTLHSRPQLKGPLREVIYHRNIEGISKDQ